jgi:hypothetical protein
MKRYVVTCCFEINYDEETMADIDTVIHELVREDFLDHYNGEMFYVVQAEEINEQR